MFLSICDDMHMRFSDILFWVSFFCSSIFLLWYQQDKHHINGLSWAQGHWYEWLNISYQPRLHINHRLKIRFNSEEKYLGEIVFDNPHSLKYPWLVLTNFAFKQSLTFLVCYNRYNWTCSTSLSSIETNCFQDNISGTFDMSDPVLTFPVSWLQSGNQYLFVLEVSASGLESGNTTQVIDIHGDALEWVNVCCQ